MINQQNVGMYGFKWYRGLAGCSLRGYCLVSVLLNRSTQYNRLFLNRTFLVLFQLCFLFVLLYIIVSRGGEVGEYIKCELIGGGSLRHLSTFSSLPIVAVHYIHINTCYVLLLLLTLPM